MFQVTFSAPCFLIKTMLKVVNGKTIGHDFLMSMVLTAEKS